MGALIARRVRAERHDGSPVRGRQRTARAAHLAQLRPVLDAARTGDAVAGEFDIDALTLDVFEHGARFSSKDAGRKWSKPAAQDIGWRRLRLPQRQVSAKRRKQSNR